MDSTIVKYYLELPSQGDKIGINLVVDYYLTIPYIIDMVPNFPAGHRLPDHAKNNVWILDISGE